MDTIHFGFITGFMKCAKVEIEHPYSDDKDLDIYRDKVNGKIPIIVFKNRSIKPKGVILFYSGATGDKEYHLDSYHKLAKNGYIAIGVDHKISGDRYSPEFWEQLHYKNRNDRMRMFNKVIDDSTLEIPEILDYVQENVTDLKNKKVGVGGPSLGGYITYLAPNIDKRVKYIFPSVANPYYKMKWNELDGDDDESFKKQYPKLLSKYPQIADQYKDVNILAQNVEYDKIMGLKQSRDFFDIMNKKYPMDQHRHQFILHKGYNHDNLPGNIVSNNILDFLEKN